MTKEELIQFLKDNLRIETNMGVNHPQDEDLWACHEQSSS